MNNTKKAPSKKRRFVPSKPVVLLAVAVLVLTYILTTKSSRKPRYECPSDHFPVMEPPYDEGFSSRHLSNNWVDNLTSFGRLATVAAESSLIDHIFGYLQPKNHHFVEFGFGYSGSPGTEKFQKAIEYTKSYHLSKNGWKGWKFDAMVEHKEEGIFKEHLSPETIVDTFKKYKIPRNVDFMCIDVDSIDIWLLEAILKNGYYRPTLLNIEYNCHFPYRSLIACEPEWSPWVRDMVYGASAAAIIYVARREDYVPIYGNFGRHRDLFLVHRKVLEKSGGIGLTTAQLRKVLPLPHKIHGLTPNSKLSRFINVRTFIETRDLQLAKECAKSDIELVKRTLFNDFQRNASL